MRLRNLFIQEEGVDEENVDAVRDGINELDVIISDNFADAMDREIGIEFNIGSRLGAPREYLIVYYNPDKNYKNNPYVFVLQNQLNRALVDTTTFASFADLAELEIRRDVNHTLAMGFKRLPKVASILSAGEINQARILAAEYDKTQAFINTEDHDDPEP